MSIMDTTIKNNPAGSPAVAGAPALGLSKDHTSIFPQSLNAVAHARFVDSKLATKESGSMEFWTKGSLVQIEGGVVPPNSSNEYEKSTSTRRGCVRDFSSKSRMRLMVFCGKVSFEELPLFVTLTYPGILTPELLAPKKWKSDLNRFAGWLLRHWPTAAAVWKLEPQRCRICKPDFKLTKSLCTCGQKLFAPHYHLIVWGVGFMPHIDLAKAWYRIVGSGQEEHLYAGIQVKKARTKNGVMCYAGKVYMGKDCQRFDGMVGRWWGILGRKNFDIASTEKVEIKCDAAKLVRRVARKYLLASKGIKVGQSQVLNIFTRDFKLWEKVGQWAADEIENRIRYHPRTRRARPF
jgi:hypothetical protein